MGAPDLAWLVVGGGIHGVHLAARLVAEGGVPASSLGILDPAPSLLHRWSVCTHNTGMTHLRSPSVHHLDVDPWSLLRFAAKRYRGEVPRGVFAPPYDRPSVELFWAHCGSVLEQYGLAGRQIRGWASSLERLGPDGVVVRLSSGEQVSAGRLILALGSSEQPAWPAWGQRLRESGGRIAHVFSPGFWLEPSGWPGRIAVVGGGISAAQVALRLAAEGREVHVLSRHALREHQFDSDPGWLGPKNMAAFDAEPCLQSRRAMIQGARHRGSLPADVLQTLRRAVSSGAIVLHHAAVSWAEGGAGAFLRLHLSDGAPSLEVEGVILATGVEPSRPGGHLVDALVAEHALPCAACGYPVVDRGLRWHPRVFVSGPLAELELGPTARNIAGARQAGARIAEAALGMGR